MYCGQGHEQTVIVEARRVVRCDRYLFVECRSNIFSKTAVKILYVVLRLRYARCEPACSSALSRERVGVYACVRALDGLDRMRQDSAEMNLHCVQTGFVIDR
jgi:hypothetical protein